jgi:prepilin-type N-terminal cleavage/methylation domain-containing protein/prepilin-type processing-associated H-X9-DG protein
MNCAAFWKVRQAFTLIELLVVIAIIAILAAMLLPTLSDRPPKPTTLICMSNLKQVALGFLLWSEDNGQLFPWEVSTNANGTMELISHGDAAGQFLTISNYLKQPSVFHCPSDKARPPASNYVSFANSNLSYFVNLVSTTNGGFAILAGDRNLSVSNHPAQPGLFQLTTSSSPGWTKELHSNKTSTTRGNLVFLDGHVESVKAQNLPAIFQRQPIATNDLVIP